MPYSAGTFDNAIKDWTTNHTTIRTVLDIGAGAGKYADMLHAINPEIILDALEPDLQYITDYNLSNRYRYVRPQTAKAYIDEQIANGFENNYDLIILGDVLEHMRKSDGLDVINYLLYHCKYMLLIIPKNMPQGVWEGHALEQHISHWGQSDFANFEYQYDFIAPMQLFVVKGIL